MDAFEDRDDAGNGADYHTGKPCIEAGCENPAGTKWSPFWCFECNVKRMKRVGASLEELSSGF